MNVAMYHCTNVSLDYFVNVIVCLSFTNLMYECMIVLVCHYLSMSMKMEVCFSMTMLLYECMII